MEEITIPNMSMENKVIREILESAKRRSMNPNVAPNWIMLPQRIADLSGAIARSAESDRMNTDVVREWAREIICHCNTLDELKMEKVK